MCEGGRACPGECQCVSGGMTVCVCVEAAEC